VLVQGPCAQTGGAPKREGLASPLRPRERGRGERVPASARGAREVDADSNKEVSRTSKLL
jgi:hypothetical protein